MKNKKFTLISIVLVMFFLFIFQLNNTFSKSQEKFDNYNVEVRGLKLKYVLIDTSLEIYQNFVKESINKSYYNEYKEHYNWLKSTYDNMSSDMKKDLELIMTSFDIGTYMDITASLSDDANIDVIIDALTSNKKIFFKFKLKSAIKDFYSSFYDNSLKNYYEENKDLYEQKAEKINKEISNNNDILSFVEKTSGITFDIKKKPIYYFVFRPAGTMYFETSNSIAFLLRGDIEDSTLLYGTAFHVYGADIFKKFESDKKYQEVMDKLKTNKEFITSYDDYNDYYNWYGWCQENLIQGFSSFLGYKFYGESYRQPELYYYDDEFYSYLREHDFNPNNTELKQACINFYNKCAKYGKINSNNKKSEN